MDAEQLFNEYEERVKNKELEKSVSGGAHVLSYFNNAEKIQNGKCKRWIIHYKENGELIATCDYTEGESPLFKSWDFHQLVEKVFEHKFIRITK